MLDDLKFVQGAISKKELIPALSHFKIQNNTIQGYNGSIALSSPIEFDIDCLPRADTFLKAIRSCKETVVMNMTSNGRLSIKSGSFKAFVECLDQTETPHVIPQGEEFEIDGEVLLKALKILEPFIGDDASRPWSNGILLKEYSAFATNNIILVEYWLSEKPFPIICNLPRDAIKEMLRINKTPEKMLINDSSITFYYPNNRWLNAVLLSNDWPDVEKILNVEEINAKNINNKLFEGLETLKSFVDEYGRVIFQKDLLVTSLENENGASYSINNFNFEGVYSLFNLLKLKTVAKKIDFTRYPQPCVFFGDRIRGAIIGMRV